MTWHEADIQCLDPAHPLKVHWGGSEAREALFALIDGTYEGVVAVSDNHGGWRLVLSGNQAVRFLRSVFEKAFERGDLFPVFIDEGPASLRAKNLDEEEWAPGSKWAPGQVRLGDVIDHLLPEAPYQISASES